MIFLVAWWKVLICSFHDFNLQLWLSFFVLDVDFKCAFKSITALVADVNDHFCWFYLFGHYFLDELFEELYLYSSFLLDFTEVAFLELLIVILLLLVPKFFEPIDTLVTMSLADWYH